MPLIIFIILVVALIIWLNRSGSGLTFNEKQYLRRRGYATDDPVFSPTPAQEDSRLRSALDSLHDISANARLRAAQDLAKLCEEGKGDARMLSSLLAALGDEDPAVRRAVAEALGKLNDPRAIEPLKRQLEKDESIHFRLAAERTLGKLENSNQE